MMQEQERAALLEAITAQINRLDREKLEQLNKFLDELEAESEG